MEVDLKTSDIAAQHAKTAQSRAEASAVAERMAADDEQFRGIIEELMTNPKIPPLVQKELKEGLETAAVHGKAAYPEKTLRQIFAEFIFSPDRFSDKLLESLSFSALIEKAEQAGKDALTGLANRSTIEKTLSDWLESKSNRSLDNQFGVIVFDVDHFKKFNDIHGHLVGDEVLKAFANYLRESFRPEDLVGRYGGEEFLVAVRATEAQIEAILEGFWFGLQGTLVEGKDHEIRASVGWTFYAKGGKAKTVDELIKEADDAMYIAKMTGRNKVVRFGENDIMTEIGEF